MTVFPDSVASFPVKVDLVRKKFTFHLITVLSRSIKRNCVFCQVVTMVRLTLMYYIDFVAFMENPDKT